MVKFKFVRLIDLFCITQIGVVKSQLIPSMQIQNDLSNDTTAQGEEPSDVPTKSEQLKADNSTSPLNKTTTTSATDRRYFPNLSSFLNLRKQASEEDSSEEEEMKQQLSDKLVKVRARLKSKVELVQKIKETRDYGKKTDTNYTPYRIGVLLRILDKSRTLINDLFNCSVKYRSMWKTLDHLKIFEYILHANVDIMTLVRQLLQEHNTIWKHIGQP